MRLQYPGKLGLFSKITSSSSIADLKSGKKLQNTIDLPVVYKVFFFFFFHFEIRDLFSVGDKKLCAIHDVTI